MTTHPTPLHELLKLTNKTVLITGAAMGIGRAIAWRYAEAGATLQLVDRDADALQQTATELREQFDAAVTTFATSPLGACTSAASIPAPYTTAGVMPWRRNWRTFLP